MYYLLNAIPEISMFNPCVFTDEVHYQICATPSFFILVRGYLHNHPMGTTSVVLFDNRDNTKIILTNSFKLVANEIANLKKDKTLIDKIIGWEKFTL